ncbi:MAG: hypothetical protein HZB66_03045 [Candidatus Aenigmarchaeota archaeon]|nr:hypothetical protein [Candidatus Aenigmarchaeota archaeon]
MNIRIKIGKKAVLISFDTIPEKFESNYERNKFFRGLYGWNQTIPKNKNESYSYRRRGVLDEVPHVKVADSAFIIPLNEAEKIARYFEEWSDKVMCEMMRITLDSVQRPVESSMKKVHIKDG